LAIREDVTQLARLTGVSQLKHAPYPWRELEAVLGTQLPSAYKTYIDVFPPGIHRGWLVVVDPRLQGGITTFVDNVATIGRVFRRLMEDAGNVGSGARFFPERGGLIPWAHYDTIVTLFWRSDDDDPDNWQIVAASEDLEWEEFSGDTIQCLLQVVRGDVSPDVFPDEFFEQSTRFVALDPRLTDD
jgi:hypothetical protein